MVHREFEELLGRVLLRQATEEESARLSAECARDASKRAIVDLLEAASSDFEGSLFARGASAGVQELALPDFERPRQLARRMIPSRRQSRLLIVVGTLLLLLAALLFHAATSPLAVLAAVAQTLVALLTVSFAWIGPALARRQARAIAAGGADWDKARQKLRRFQAYLAGPWPTRLLWFSMLLIISGAVLLLTEPRWIGFGAISVGIAVIIAVECQKWTMRQLRGENDDSAV